MLDFWSRHPPKGPCPCPSVIPKSSVERCSTSSPPAGRPIAQIAADLNISDQTIYGWGREELTDTGQLPGLNRAELAELSAANRRIRELGTEVAILEGARGLLKEPHDPKDGTRP